MQKPQPGTYPPYYQPYIDRLADSDILDQLEVGLETATRFFQSIDKEKEDYRYAEGKWSVKEVFGHIIDSERVFSYRALCISRGESAALPGYDENQYVANGNFASRSIQSLLDEYTGLRRSGIALFRSLSEEQLLQMGTANGKPVQVAAIIAIIAGHELHHINVLRERYFSEQYSAA